MPYLYRDHVFIKPQKVLAAMKLQVHRLELNLFLFVTLRYTLRDM